MIVVAVGFFCFCPHALAVVAEVVRVDAHGVETEVC